MWAAVKHKAILTDTPEIINNIRYFVKLRPISEDRPIKGIISRSKESWYKKTIEEFFYISTASKAVKVVGLDILTDDTYQVTYYLNGKLEGKKHSIAPRYLLGRFGKSECLFRLIAFDFIPEDAISEQDLDQEL